MIGPKSTTKMMVTCSTQVTLESIARELADCENKLPCGYVMKKEEAVKVDNKRSTKMVSQGTETDDLATDNSGRVIVGPPRPLLSSGRENVLEFSLLRLVFPNIETVVLRHQLEMSNYKEVFQMMMSLKEDTVNPPHIIDHNILFDEKDSNQWSQVAASSKPTPRVLPKKLHQESCNFFLNRKCTKQENLEEAQKKALEARKRIDSVRNEKYSSPQRSPRNAVSKEIKAIDSKLRQAHDNPWYLDLHYMSVEGAVSLVNEAIEAARFIIKSKRRASTKIKVVTGSGNNSRHGPKIRPEIEAFLRNNKISYDFVNSGCFLIKLD